MSSLTIDELKKVLNDNGVDVPPGRLKKEEYLRLYEEHITVNSSADAGFSDEEKSSQNSTRVTSTDEIDVHALINQIKILTNDELFFKLQEAGYNPGPVLPNTRKVYEKKFLSYLRGEGILYTNGTDSSSQIDSNELSDSEVLPDLPPERPKRRSVTPQVLAREPTPSFEPVRERSVPRRFTYIERIPRGSTERIIEPVPSGEGDVGPRQRVLGDSYKGKWSPSATLKASPLTGAAVPAKQGKSLWVILGFFAVLIVLLIFAYTQWAATDPYKMLEQDAEDFTEEK